MKALIVVDLQEEWRDPDSENYVGDLNGLIRRINELIDYCRSKGYKIIFTRHVDEEFKSELVKELNKKPSDKIIIKNRISPFYKTKLEQELVGVDELIVCGLLTNLCIRSLIQDAYDRSFKITVISDCCTTYDKATHEFTLKDLKETREEIKIMKLKQFTC